MVRPFVNDDAEFEALSVGMDWHLRLGHPGLPIMHAMSGKGMIPRVYSAESEVVSECEVCCQ